LSTHYFFTQEQLDMAPPSAIEPQNGDETRLNTTAPLEPGLDEKKGKTEMLHFPKPPTFDDPYKERAYLKGRLAAAFRIFGKCGFDEGVAGHITLRVSQLWDPIMPQCLIADVLTAFRIR
jgi:hypothetical protein